MHTSDGSGTAAHATGIGLGLSTPASPDLAQPLQAPEDGPKPTARPFASDPDPQSAERRALRQQHAPRTRQDPHAPGWYVIQVQTGREEAMCQIIERTAAEADQLSDIDGYHLVEECFSPRFETERKFHGEFHRIEKPLLPGYVVAVTQDPATLARMLYRVPDFTRLLTFGEMFVPLRDDERAWIESSTHVGDRTVPMSFGYREGDRLVVTEGPLKGREGMVTRINRAKSLAFLEFDVHGKKITTTVGLGIVPKERT